MNTPHHHRMHNITFGPHFHIIVSTADDGGMLLEYTHHGFDLLSDPDGRLMAVVFKVAARYGRLTDPAPCDRILLETWTPSGMGVMVYERAGRTYLQLAKGRKAYALDASEVNGPLEQFINAVRRRFPDLRTD